MKFYKMNEKAFEKLEEGFHKQLHLEDMEVSNKPYTDGFLYVAPIFRSVTTNEVVPVPLAHKEDKLFSACPVTCNSENEALTFQIMDAVVHYIQDNLQTKTVDNKIFRDSLFKPYGILKMNGVIILLVNIIIKDENISLLKDKSANLLYPQKINNLSKCTNLSQLDTLVISTLIITT